MEKIIEKLMAQIGAGSADHKAYLDSLLPEEWSKEAKAIPEMADMPRFMAAQRYKGPTSLPPILIQGIMDTKNQQAALGGFDRITDTSAEYARLVDGTIQAVFTGELKMTQFGPENYPLRILAERIRRLVRYVIDLARTGHSFSDPSECLACRNYCCTSPECPEIIFQRELLQRIVREASGDRKCAANVRVFPWSKPDEEAGAATQGK
jgi:hypothetical protein